MDVRAQRIVEVAMELAERDGYDAVRLREVSDQAGVALGTLYRRFASKEDILVAALEVETERLQDHLRARPIRGGTSQHRLEIFFKVATRGLLQRPKLAHAMLRTLCTGAPELTSKVNAYHGVMTSLILDAYRGAPVDVDDPADALTEGELDLAFLLQQVWFASLVGWAASMHSEQAVVDQLATAIGLVLPTQSQDVEAS